MCLNGTTFLKEERNQIRKDSLLKVIDIYDNMTIKQKKMMKKYVYTVTMMLMV